MVLMLDINSVEFYTIAFVVAMALVGLLMGRTEKKPPSTYIFQLLTMPSSSCASRCWTADVCVCPARVCLSALKKLSIWFSPSGTSSAPLLRKRACVGADR